MSCCDFDLRGIYVPFGLSTDAPLTRAILARQSSLRAAVLMTEILVTAIFMKPSDWTDVSCTRKLRDRGRLQWPIRSTPFPARFLLGFGTVANPSEPMSLQAMPQVF